MHYAIIIPDGCADEPQVSLGGRTPLQAARTLHMDRIAQMGRVGRANNVPASLTPASDVATLSLFGYDPLVYYTGRAPLEAAAMGIRLGPHDWAIRCNLVHIDRDPSPSPPPRSGEGVGAEVMRDFTAGHISSEEGRQLIATLQEHLGNSELEFHAGVQYRNLLVYRGGGKFPNLPGKFGNLPPREPFSAETKTQAPHDIPDKPIADYLPRGPGGELLRDLMMKSRQLFKEHPVNQARAAKGKRTANQIWLWGQGQAPSLPPFEQVYGKRGAIITAVDLVRGVGALLGWKRIDVAGATGYLDTDYAAKGRAAVAALPDYDLVCVHVEAPDEASHEGKVEEKIKAVERIDEHIVGPVLEALSTHGDWRILVSPDHPTPLRTRAHAHGFVPFAMAGNGIAAEGAKTYDEITAATSPHVFDPGWRLMRSFLA
jgi:2,3-bisphosphoglycerate-independent phosphoglycerate mutase